VTWRLAAQVQQPGGQLPQPPAERVPVLVDEHHVVVVIQREDGHRAVVLNHLASCEVSVGHAHHVGA
jgi:hypothetical protein